MKKFYQELKKVLNEEMGTSMATEITLSLQRRSLSWDEMKKLFYQIGVAWTPLLILWRDWIKKNAIYPPAIIMRDGEPLHFLPDSNQWTEVYLNRLNLGIPDELSGNNSQTMDPLARSYLTQKNLHNFTYVDGGAWGSIVLKLYLMGIIFQPLFLYSHNPNIPGFINSLGIYDKDGELLNDSLECSFIKAFQRPDEFVLNAKGIVVPKIVPYPSRIVELSKQVLRGVQEEGEKIAKDNRLLPNPTEAIESLLKLSREARRSGLFTGILPYNSPTWSEGQDFLDNWPKHLKWTR